MPEKKISPIFFHFFEKNRKCLTFWKKFSIFFKKSKLFRFFSNIFSKCFFVAKKYFFSMGFFFKFISWLRGIVLKRFQNDSISSKGEKNELIEILKKIANFCFTNPTKSRFLCSDMTENSELLSVELRRFLSTPAIPVFTPPPYFLRSENYSSNSMFDVSQKRQNFSVFAPQARLKTVKTSFGSKKVFYSE